MTFITKRIEPTPSGLHVRYFIRNDSLKVNRYGDIEWADVVAITGVRRQYVADNAPVCAINIYQDGGESEDFIDAPFVDGWLSLVNAIGSSLVNTTGDWFQRLVLLEPHQLWQRDHKHFKELLIYQRDEELPPIFTETCEFCGGKCELIT